MRGRPAIATLLFLTGGLVIWAVRFLIVYAFAALACAKAFADAELLGAGVVPAIIGLSSVVAIALNGWIAMRGLTLRRSATSRKSADAELPSFVGFTAAAVAALSIVAIVWETVPVFFVTVCE